MEMGETKGTDILKEKGNIPIIVMTGRGDFSLETAISHGFSGYLAKPFNLESIKEVIGVGYNDFDSFKLEEDEEILQLFKTSTKENIIKLNNALKNCDFNMAQATCHKMYPMFAQFGYPTEELKRMDLNRENEYNGWQNDVKNLLKKIEGII
jgi:Response regulator receiver domain.